MKELIVITGASSGIGEATAKAFSKIGHPLLLIARRIEKLEVLNLENTICAQVDVTNFDEVKATIKNAEDKYGKTGCLVNNAGAMLLGSIDTQKITEWQKMFDLNVMAVLNCMQAVLGDMKKRKSGTIINISSVAGKKTFPAHAAYCGTKFAIHGITENVREEVAPFDVRVITIAPGAVETELLSHTTDDEIIAGYEQWKESMGGVIIPEDVARSIAFVYSQPQNVNLDKSVITQNNKEIHLTLQEKALLNELSSMKFVGTSHLANLLKVNSQNTVRTIINRIRKKLNIDIFEQKKTFGYKLKSIEVEEKEVFSKSAIEELEEQNSLIQNVIDSSPIFIVTFIHKQLYCINKSFRDYLGVETIKELWDEEKGDFFQLIIHNSNETEKLKATLFTNGKHKIKLYETNNNKTSFEIETFYFENLDKHLFIFK